MHCISSLDYGLLLVSVAVKAPSPGCLQCNTGSCEPCIGEKPHCHLSDHSCHWHDRLPFQPPCYPTCLPWLQSASISKNFHVVRTSYCMASDRPVGLETILMSELDPGRLGLIAIFSVLHCEYRAPYSSPNKLKLGPNFDAEYGQKRHGWIKG